MRVEGRREREAPPEIHKNTLAHTLAQRHMHTGFAFSLVKFVPVFVTRSVNMVKE
jgi:hypothetical protein